MKRRIIITAPSRVTVSVLAAALSQLLLCSCQQSDADAPQPAPRQPVALQLTSGIAATVTRAYDATWESNDKIGVFTVKAGSTSASDITYSGTTADANIPYTTTGGVSHNGTSYNYITFSAANPDNPIFLPIDGSNVDVYAYYPFTSTTTPATPSNAGVTISSDNQTLTVNLEMTQTEVGQKQYDLMTAKVLSSDSPINIDHSTASLTFTHCLSKVLIRIVAGTGYETADLTGKTSVKLTGQPVMASLDPLTQALTITTGSNDIVPLTLTSGDDYAKLNGAAYIYRALVLPNTASGGTNPASATGRTIEITVGNTKYTYTITDSFAAGKETTFTITLAATGISVKAAIQPWTTEPVSTPILYEDHI